MPNNKKQRGRDSQKKKEAQNAAQKKVEAVVRRAQIEAELQGKFGTPAVDKLIRDMAAAATAVSISSSNATTEKDDGVCYHGSSVEYFVAGSEFLKIVKSYVVLCKKNAGCTSDQYQDNHDKFFADRENRKIMNNVEFTDFVFALGVSLYLKLTSKEKENYLRLQQLSDICSMKEIVKAPSYELEFILHLGLTLKYDVIPEMIGEKVNEEQLLKYLRDVDNERGIINRLYRETKNQCYCMKTRKKAANKMDKMVFCEACCKVFPKAETKLCDRCKAVAYCSEECSSTHWPRHKQFCTYSLKRTDATKINEV